MRTRIRSTPADKELIDVGLLVNTHIVVLPAFMKQLLQPYYHTFKCACSTLQDVITDDDQVCCSSNI